MKEISDLVQYGAVGLCLALIISMLIMARYVYKLFSNHLNHLSSALNKFTEVLSDIRGVIQGCPTNKLNK